MTDNNHTNLILASDSYKLTHWSLYPEGTTRVYSYMEARAGAEHDSVIFFGLQYLLKKYLTTPVTAEDVAEAAEIAEAHFGNAAAFNRAGWERLLEKHGGKLPLEIKAVPEGTRVPVGNVLLTVENTDDEFAWLTNYVESLLLHLWYPTTVATRSAGVKDIIRHYLEQTSENLDGLPFMLHDFGYRGVSSHESAGIGGAAHLVNFVGTDTLPALQVARNYYGAELATLAYSVTATEHSVMTAEGEEGEHDVVQHLLDNHPAGILSVVNDSYDAMRHVRWLCTDFKEQILAREGVFVTRPDSVPSGSTPASVVIAMAMELWNGFGGTYNHKGYKVLNPKIRILWGDGIEPEGVKSILDGLRYNNFSAECMAAFGMGGGLLQKVNRDTERFSIKSSAQKRADGWHDISKNAPGKKSKAGKLALVRNAEGTLFTVPQASVDSAADLLVPVFRDGEILKEYSFDEVRANASS